MKKSCLWCGKRFDVKNEVGLGYKVCAECIMKEKHKIKHYTERDRLLFKKS